MGWIDIEKQMPPEGLQVLLEVSGRSTGDHGEATVWDHGFIIGTWILPEGEEEIEWILQTRHEVYFPKVHGWMPLPRHFQKQDIFNQEDDLMEHAMFEDDPEWLYKDDCVYEQMSLEDFMKGV